MGIKPTGWAKLLVVAERFVMGKINMDGIKGYNGCTFLGGTCGKSTWRHELIAMLHSAVPYFNPQVDDWTPEDAAREDACKPLAGLNVFVITGDALGTYSGWEICEESNRAPEKLVFAAIGELPDNQVKGVNKIKVALRKKGSKVCETLEEVASVINQHYAK